MTLTTLEPDYAALVTPPEETIQDIETLLTKLRRDKIARFMERLGKPTQIVPWGENRTQFIWWVNDDWEQGCLISMIADSGYIEAKITDEAGKRYCVFKVYL